MKRFFAVLSSLTALLLLLFGLFRDPPETPPFHDLIQVHDGDTITIILDGEKTTIRYLLMDTPELHHPSRPKEELASEAWDENTRLVTAGKLRLEFDVERWDRYGRLLAYVWLSLPEGEILINEEMVRRGLALPLIIPPNGKHADRIFRAMGAARDEKRGFWKKAERRVFSPAQVWSEAPILAGNFVTVIMDIEKIEERGKRIFLREGRTSLCAYRSAETEELWKLKRGDRVEATGKVVLSYGGCEIPIVSFLQIRKISDE